VFILSNGLNTIWYLFCLYFFYIFCCCAYV